VIGEVFFRPTASMLARSLRDNGEMYYQIKAAEEGWKATVAHALG
jgi:hypothetical protein